MDGFTITLNYNITKDPQPLDLATPTTCPTVNDSRTLAKTLQDVTNEVAISFDRINRRARFDSKQVAILAY